MSIYIKLQGLCVCIVLCVTGTCKASVQIGESVVTSMFIDGSLDVHRWPSCSNFLHRWTSVDSVLSSMDSSKTISPDMDVRQLHQQLDIVGIGGHLWNQ